jgi:dihydroflavonol-4-reductase
MKVLVTGGTGFIGSRLIERLHERGWDVVCVSKDRLNCGSLEALGVEAILGDLTNGIAWNKVLEGVDVVYHVAGVTRGRTLDDYYAGNTRATESLLASVLRYRPGLRRFVYVSSQSAAGPSIDGKPVNEHDTCHPVSTYGKSKFLAEQAVLRAAGCLPVTILRPSVVYGPREKDMLSYMQTVRMGIHLLIGRGKKYLNLIHVDDLVRGIIQASESPAAVGQTYFLASERVYDEEEVGDTIAEVVRRRPLRIHVPHVVAYIIGAIGNLCALLLGRNIFLNVQKVREVVQTAWTCSVEKAVREFGFHQEISLHDGMAMTYRWYRDHGWMH